MALARVVDRDGDQYDGADPQGNRDQDHADATPGQARTTTIARGRARLNGRGRLETHDMKMRVRAVCV